jgi:hypothetical protein
VESGHELHPLGFRLGDDYLRVDVIHFLTTISEIPFCLGEFAENMVNVASRLDERFRVDAYVIHQRSIGPPEYKMQG